MSLSFNSAQAKISANAVPYYILGLNWQKKGNFAEAEKNFRKAVSLSEEDADLRATLADLLWREGQIENALTEFANATNLAPKNARLRILYGKALLQNKLFNQATDQFKMAAELEPDYPYIYYNLGQSEQLAGNAEKAILYLQKALKEDPQNLKIISDIATSQHQMGLLDQAIQGYQFILSQETADDLTRTNLARALAEKGDLINAEKEYAILLSNTPNRTDLLSAMAELQYRKGNLNKASELINQALQFEPNDATLHAIFASYMEQQKKLKEALEHYQLAAQFENNPEKRSKYFFAIAQLHFKKGDYSLASVLLEDLLKKNPQDYSLKVQLADIRLWQKKYSEATFLYREVLALQPQYVQNKALLFNYGAALNGARDWPNAEIVWNNYHKLERKNKDSWLNLASVQVSQKKYPEAIYAYKTAQSLGAAKLNILNQIGPLQIQENDLAGAEITYRELMNLKPDQSKYRLTLSRVLSKQGKQEEAIKLLRDSDQNSTKLRLELAERIANSGDYYSAASEYQKIITDEPNSYEAVLGLADSYSAIGQFSESSKLYKRYLGTYPNNFHAQYNYALALANSGQENESVNEYKKAIEINPSYAESYYALGAVLLDKDSNQTRDYWRKYLEIQPQGEYKSEILHHFPDLK